MRPLLLTTFACIALYATLHTNPSDVRLIARLDEVIQRRFAALPITTLGMSRVVQPSSFGEHFQPVRTAERDFQPTSAVEEVLIADMERAGLQVGLYLFGAAIEKAAPDALNFRALKGPGAITKGTPRPRWYPGLLDVTPRIPPSPDALPGWKTIYPVA